MERARFENLVARAVERLPKELRERLENIDIVVEDFPTHHQLASVGLRRGESPLGLYEGVPLTQRSSHYGLVPPDKITIFQRAIEHKCHYESEIANEIQAVVRHEIAHHFGISDARLDELSGDSNG